jgi:alpha-mannosidase
VRSGRDAECGLVAAGAGADPLIAPERTVLHIAPDTVVASALKPAEHGDGVVLRLLNPTDEPVEAVVEPGPALAAAIGAVRAVRLDETPDDFAIRRDGRRLRVTLPPRALRSLRIDGVSRAGGGVR